jgi:sugar lactone lactonase YvrE
MNGDRDLDRVLEMWLSEGASEMPDRLFEAVTDRIERVPQARVARLHLRFSDMKPNQRLAAAAAVILLVVVGGIAVLGRFSDRNGGQPPIASPSPSLAEPSISAIWSPRPGIWPFDATGLAVDATGHTYVSSCPTTKVYRAGGATPPSDWAGGGALDPASGDGGSALSSRLRCPYGLAVDRAANLYIADYDAGRIQRVSPDGVITSVAGGGSGGASVGDGGPAIMATLLQPVAVAFGPDGSLYIADLLAHRIRKVDASGIITTVAGNGTGSFSGDGGRATEAGMDPLGIVVAADGTIFITDSNRVRRIDTAGIITTIAGTGVDGSTGDGGPATAATFSDAESLLLDGKGNLLVGDVLGNRVRRIDGDGVIHAFAGTGAKGFAGDGGPAVDAMFDSTAYAMALAIDARGNVYIADGANQRVRVVDTNGIISTLGG